MHLPKGVLNKKEKEEQERYILIFRKDTFLFMRKTPRKGD